MSTHGKPSSSGDEPYYLIASHSLLVDHDLDVANNFAQDDGRDVGADGLTPSSHVANARDALWPGEVGDNRLLNPMPLIGPALNGIFPVINPGTWRQ
jgi:hypothetical protein